MILQSLVAYYEQLAQKGKVGVDGWSSARVAYAITIDVEGNVKSIVSIQKQETRKNKQVLVPTERVVPLQKGRSRNASPNFMCDNAKYLLGAWKKTGAPEEDSHDREKAREYFQAAAAYHQRILGQTENPYAQSICKFFQKWDFEKEAGNILVDLDDLLAAPNLVFRSFETSRELLEDAQIREI